MPEIDPDKPLPTIDSRKVIAKSRFFKVEQVDLTFANGAKRQFERMVGSGHGAVMIVAITHNDELLLVREYAAGTHSYQLGFPKGLIDPGETPAEAAERELKEEAGFGAKELVPLHTVAMAPAFFDSKMHILIARDLYPETLEGDEPEPLEVITWPLSDLENLLTQSNFVEARSIAALLLTQKWLKEN